MTTPYNLAYSPPIPVLQVTFSSGDNGAQVGPLEAIVDTGADATIVPQEIELNKLSLFLDGPVQQTEALDDATVNRLRARQQ